MLLFPAPPSDFAIYGRVFEVTALSEKTLVPNGV